MAKVALTGGAYLAHSVIASAQRSVNLFSEPVPEAQGEPMPAAHYPTPGTRLLATIGPGPIRGIRQCTTGGLYVVSGSNVYSINVADWTGTLLGTITPGLRTPVSMADNGLDLVIVDGTASGWKITLASNAFASMLQVETMAPSSPVTGTDPIVLDHARYSPFVPAFDGIITSATVSLAAGYTGLMKCTVFSAALGSVVSSANVITNPISGMNTLVFHNPVSVTKGAEYWLGFVSNTTAGAWNHGTAGSAGAQSVTTYASFPVVSPPGTIPASPLITTISTSTDPDGAFVGADRVDYLDTFFVFNKPKTPRFYWSGSLALTFDDNDAANKQSYSDLLVTLIVAKREIWLLGERTSEVWYDVGVKDTSAVISSQFEQVQSVFIDHGCAAKYSVANYDNGIFWLTRDRQGQGFVIHGAGYQTKRISTYAIEAEIAGYTRIDDAIGFCYQIGGHTFYVLTFPHADKTWAHDITTGLWHEWLWIDSNGNEHRHRANAFWPVNSTLVVGDWQNGNLYELRRDVFTDNGQPIKRLRSFPHLVNDGKRVFYRSFIADMETGTSTHVNMGAATLLDARFSAADGTNLSAYISDVGGGWAAVDGEANAEIVDARLVGTGGEAMYRSYAAPTTANYSVRFSVVPPSYTSVVADTSLWAIGRAVTINTGYRVTVSADGTQYSLSLTGGGGSSPVVSMGTISAGTYTVWLVMRGQIITAQVQRTQDGLWLRTDGVWRTEPGTVAAQFNDAVYAAPGLIVIGGVWP